MAPVDGRGRRQRMAAPSTCQPSPADPGPATMLTMEPLVIDSRGRITIPRRLRERMSLRAGDRVVVHTDATGRLVVTPAGLEPDELFAGQPSVARSLSLAEIDAALGMQDGS